jgi:hypothetical protein
VVSNILVLGKCRLHCECKEHLHFSIEVSTNQHPGTEAGGNNIAVASIGMAWVAPSFIQTLKIVSIKAICEFAAEFYEENSEKRNCMSYVI